LGEQVRAEALFDEIARRAEAALAEESIDFFSKFGQRQREAARRSGAYYLLGLAESGRGNVADALAWFESALELDTSMIWARYNLAKLRSHGG
jgi:tetratricopeptide (TPR) repeat protein